MKFRTDFVTNSSSSAFCVSFNMKLRDGGELSCSFEDAWGDEDMSEIKVGDHSLHLDKCDLYTMIEGERLEIIPDELGDVSLCDVGVYDVGGNVREHSVTDVDLSSVRTAEDLLGQLVRLCELDGDHFDESNVDIAIYGDGDSEGAKDAIIKSLKEIGARESTWQSAMRDEIATILAEHLRTWDDVIEATVKFKDNGWGSEALGEYALAEMIPDGSRVIVGSNSGKELTVGEGNWDEIVSSIDDSVVQKYVAGDDVVFII